MKGKIIKGIAGFYYVHADGFGVYECKAKGIFRKQGVKPLVGDRVEIDILSETEKEGNITEIAERKNALIRPAVANIDQALLIFAVRDPEPNYNLLDRFLVMMRYQKIPVILCFNKTDLAVGGEVSRIAGIYQGCGFPVFFTNARTGEGMDRLRMALKEKTSALAGPSGVGKSSVINCLQQDVHMKTGAISKKIGRGKNTTRHSQLIHMEGDSYIMDTPGFGSLDVLGLAADDLWKYYGEFEPFEPYCRFQGCSHIHEPDCGVRQALGEGKIHRGRYETYVSIYQELKEMEKREWRKL